MSKKKFQVGIMHGHSKDFLQIKEFVSECGFTPRILADEFQAETIFERLRNLVWDELHCVIIVMTKDDEMKNGAKRSRQNVVFELGYCFAAFDSIPEVATYNVKNAIIVILEKGVEIFSDIDGLTRIEYETSNIMESKKFIMETLKKSYKLANNYYNL